MFKKPVEAKSHQRLSGADRKKFRRTIKDRFPNASDAEIDVLIPPKAEITLSKLANRAHVYSVEGGFPMFFDADGRCTDIFPTVFALWQVPQLLPTFELKGGEVSRFVLGGADLMFPGIRIPEEGLSSFSSGELWAVKVPGNVSPIAVGTTTMSRAEAIKAGLRGKALRIAHYYRDSLWGSVEGHYVPNAGFYEDIVIEDPALLLSSHPADESDSCKGTSDSCKGTSDTLQNDSNVAGQEELPEASGDIEIDKDIIDKSQEVDEYIPEKLIGDADSLTISDVVSSEEANSDSHNLVPEEVDALLDKCLLQALHASVKDKDIPMAGSILWSVHVLPCRPSGVTLDIKRSSHKKLSKWLQFKASTGLITVKEDKHKKETILQAVNRLHPDYTSFRPEKKQTDLTQQCSNSVSESKPKKLQIDVSEIFKASTHVAPILTSVGAEPGNFYTAAEATDIVFRYIEMENLVKPTDKAMVVLNATLCDALYKGAIKKGSSYPTEIHKKDLGATFLNRMQVHYKVVRGNEAAVRKGSVKPVQIMTERRQGNKKVTRVSGIETFLMDAEALASELQKKFACSTTVAELPGKKGQHEVLVQGGVIDDLAKQLVDHYGIPKRYIEVLDKTRR